jgi:hypothetical protein
MCMYFAIRVSTFVRLILDRQAHYCPWGEYKCMLEHLTQSGMRVGSRLIGVEE